MPSIREHDGLPNSDATKQATDTESSGQIMVPPREQKAFPSNINQEGRVIFSVSYTYSPLSHGTKKKIYIYIYI